jgi:hypothetical protein
VVDGVILIAVPSCKSIGFCFIVVIELLTVVNELLTSVKASPKSLIDVVSLFPTYL